MDDLDFGGNAPSAEDPFGSVEPDPDFGGSGPEPSLPDDGFPPPYDPPEEASPEDAQEPQEPDPWDDPTDDPEDSLEDAQEDDSGSAGFDTTFAGEDPPEALEPSDDVTSSEALMGGGGEPEAAPPEPEASEPEPEASEPEPEPAPEPEPEAEAETTSEPEPAQDATGEENPEGSTEITESEATEPESEPEPTEPEATQPEPGPDPDPDARDTAAANAKSPTRNYICFLYAGDAPSGSAMYQVFGVVEAKNADSARKLAYGLVADSLEEDGQPIIGVVPSKQWRPGPVLPNGKLAEA